MGLVAVPNVSEGRSATRIDALAHSVRSRGGRLLDVHSDADHNRSVFTVAGTEGAIVRAMAELAAAAVRHIDLRRHTGVHPRLGALDVCPIVPIDTPMEHAIAVARRIGEAIATSAGLPVYLYGEAATRNEIRELPALRRGGLEALARRAALGLRPDFGPRAISPESGVVCVGARDVLIAFNVWLRCDLGTARNLARLVRSSEVRALGLPVGGPGVAQVSMNLTNPAAAGIEDVYAAVAKEARSAGAKVVATEIVGLVPERFMPDRQKEAARLLIRPGRSLESALRAS